MKKIIMLTAGLALLAGAPAQANEPYLPRSPKSFEKVDANRDGKVALTEIAPLAERRLARLDSNGDKSVTAAELEERFQQALKKRVERIMRVMDSNRDGAISEAELDNLMADMFNTADNDKDGGLTLAEARNFKRGAWRKAYLTREQPAAASGN